MREKELSVDMLLAEIIRLRELCKDAAEEIRYLDNILMECFYDNRPPHVDNPVDFGTFSSVNLISRLDGRLGPSIESIINGKIEDKICRDRIVVELQNKKIVQLEQRLKELDQ